MLTTDKDYNELNDYGKTFLVVFLVMEGLLCGICAVAMNAPNPTPFWRTLAQGNMAMFLIAGIPCICQLIGAWENEREKRKIREKDSWDEIYKSKFHQNI